MVDAQLFRDGTPLTLTGPTITGTKFTFEVEVISFNDNYVGNYNCSATVQSSSQFIIGMEQGMAPLIRLTIGKLLQCSPQANFKADMRVWFGWSL